MDTTRKGYDMFKVFVRLHVLYGSYDGHAIVRDRKQYIRARLFLVFLIFHWMKYTAPLFFAKESLVQFYMADAANHETAVNHRYVASTCCLYVGWEIVNYVNFLRVNRNDRNGYWLRLIPHRLNVLTPETVIGVNEKQLHQLLAVYHASGRFAAPCLIFMSFVMSWLMNFTYFSSFYSRKHLFPFFWSAAIYNMLSLWFVMTHAFSITLLPSLAYTYLSHLQWIRFRNIRFTLIRLSDRDARSASTVASKRSSSKTQILVDQTLRHFHLVAIQTSQLNFFWSNFFGVNFFFSTSLIFFFVLEVSYGTLWQFRVGYGVLCAFIYINSLMLPNFLSSRVQSEVTQGHSVPVHQSTQRIKTPVFFLIFVQIFDIRKPIEKLLTRKDLSIKLLLRLSSTIEYIESDFAGFTCFKFFLIRKSTIISVTISANEPFQI
jgi:hypothetical protein